MTVGCAELMFYDMVNIDVTDFVILMRQRYAHNYIGCNFSQNASLKLIIAISCQVLEEEKTMQL